MAIVATKLALFVGVFALLGPGVVVRFVARGAVGGPATLALRRTAIAGGILVLVASGLSLLATLVDVLGYVDGQLFRQFLASSTQGRAALVRCALVLTLPVVSAMATRTVDDARWGARTPDGARPRPGATDAQAPSPARRGFRPWRRAFGDAAWAAWALGILGTYTAVSHNAAMHGWWPLAADLVHLVAAVVWIGAVLGIAFVPGLRNEPATFERAIGRVSAIALVSVATLFGTGVFSATLHVGQPSYLATTTYGWALSGKVAAVLVIVAIAARNRWHHMPRARSGEVTPAFLRSLRWESTLLAVVLGVTALLTSLPPPH